MIAEMFTRWQELVLITLAVMVGTVLANLLVIPAIDRWWARHQERAGYRSRKS